MKPRRALSPALEAALMREVARLDLRPAPTPDAPASLADLLSLNPRAGRIPVWSGASTWTIWSAPAVNWAYRAWHDSIHWRLGVEFDPAGELAVARASLYIAPTARDRAILWAETWGQVAALARSGSFPEDQRTWVARAAGVAR